jgi:hypothetical protein
LAQASGSSTKSVKGLSSKTCGQVFDVFQNRSSHSKPQTSCVSHLSGGLYQSTLSLVSVPVDHCSCGTQKHFEADLRHRDMYLFRGLLYAAYHMAALHSSHTGVTLAMVSAVSLKSPHLVRRELARNSSMSLMPILWPLHTQVYLLDSR